MLFSSSLKWAPQSKFLRFKRIKQRFARTTESVEYIVDLDELSAVDSVCV